MLYSNLEDAFTYDNNKEVVNNITTKESNERILDNTKKEDEYNKLLQDLKDKMFKEYKNNLNNKVEIKNKDEINIDLKNNIDSLKDDFINLSNNFINFKDKINKNYNINDDNSTVDSYESDNISNDNSIFSNYKLEDLIKNKNNSVEEKSQLINSDVKEILLIVLLGIIIIFLIDLVVKVGKN